MELQAFNAGCNVLAINKNNCIYAMTCSWSTMIDYDKVAMLIGSQSETGKILKVGDIVGISALSKGQKKIAYFIGSHHSSEINKLDGIKHILDNSAVFIDGAKVIIKAEVKNILHLEGLEQDNYVIFQVLDFKQDGNKKFLSAYE